MITILTVNSGSSSVRLTMFSEDSGKLTKLAVSYYEPADPVELLSTFLDENDIKKISAVSHRIVHGGERLVATCLIDADVRNEIKRLSPLAPLHNPIALTWVETCGEVLGPTVPQIAVFDTAFFSGMPEVAKIYALPGDLCRKHGIRRYGFHGLAHRAMWERLCSIRPDFERRGKAISLQLGAGCSITAVDSGHAMDTSMGFSPLEGLVMATRSGDVDSRVVTYMQREMRYGVDEVEDMLNRSSGLLGVSEASADMRTLLETNNPNARLAVDLYSYRARKYIGAYMAALGGADAIVFGGGVGENAPAVRTRILSGMKWCGVEIDGEANDTLVGKEGIISSPDSQVEVWVLPVDEAAIMANEAIAVLRQT